MAIKKKRKRSRRDSYDSDEEDTSRTLFDDINHRDDDFDEGKTDQLHPIFENPKFPPSELKALVLGEVNGKQVSVPASLSRYLAPFQKEGVDFMYKVLSGQSGVILGDDMGR